MASLEGKELKYTKHGTAYYIGASGRRVYVKGTKGTGEGAGEGEKKEGEPREGIKERRARKLREDGEKKEAPGEKHLADMSADELQAETDRRARVAVKEYTAEAWRAAAEAYRVSAQRYSVLSDIRNEANARGMADKLEAAAKITDTPWNKVYETGMQRRVLVRTPEQREAAAAREGGLRNARGAYIVPPMNMEQTQDRINTLCKEAMNTDATQYRGQFFSSSEVRGRAAAHANWYGEIHYKEDEQRYQSTINQLKGTATGSNALDSSAAFRLGTLVHENLHLVGQKRSATDWRDEQKNYQQEDHRALEEGLVESSSRAVRGEVWRNTLAHGATQMTFRGAGEAYPFEVGVTHHVMSWCAGSKPEIPERPKKLKDTAYISWDVYQRAAQTDLGWHGAPTDPKTVAFRHELLTTPSGKRFAMMSQAIVERHFKGPEKLREKALAATEQILRHAYDFKELRAASRGKTTMSRYPHLRENYLHHKLTTMMNATSKRDLVRPVKEFRRGLRNASAADSELRTIGGFHE